MLFLLQELFIRWTQVTAYMPSMQFSFVPWQYDEETIEICRKAVDRHEKVVTPIVLEAARRFLVDGANLNKTKQRVQHQMDNDMYLFIRAQESRS